VAILFDEDTKVLVWGLTGREGSFHAQQNREYGTRVVGGVTPGKGGRNVGGIPVFNTGAEAAAAVGGDVGLIFAPARFACDAAYEAAASGCTTVVIITEGIPARETLRLQHYLRSMGVRMIGPNCPGVICPGVCNVGIMPTRLFKQGRIGIVSRSGTLTYQVADELARWGRGVSTAVGIGGDAIVGTGFTEILPLFEQDAETDATVLIGEIGGSEEERAALLWQQSLKKPVVAYVAGFTAPPGRQMGHAGAIISGSSGTAEAKKQALEEAGIRVARHPAEVPQLLESAYGLCRA
jgi:succinyl-CoA synthetase alpha subunit